jgi:hypothetical protein
MTGKLKNRAVLVAVGAILLVSGYVAGSRKSSVVLAAAPMEGAVPKSYGRLVTAIADQIGTGLVFEGADGTIRFVSINGMKEGQLARYDQTPTQGGIPKSYGHLVAAVVNGKGTGLVFEDAEGTIRFVTIAGVKEGELKRE